MAYKTISVLPDTFDKLQELKLKRSFEVKKEITYDELIKELLGEPIKEGE